MSQFIRGFRGRGAKRDPRLPPGQYDIAVHCVTMWSKFDMTFTGASVDTLLDAVRPLPSALSS
jgi:hypothetical protein